MRKYEEADLHEDSFKSDILKTIIYFDLFNYPLIEEEIFHFCQNKHLPNGDYLRNFLNELTEEGLLFRINNYYLLHNDPTLVQRRLKGNQYASKMMELAYKITTLISCFPFVRSVMLSGSISKGYMEKGSDIDFFIITAPGKLWITRTLLVLFKRIFLFNSHKYFCVNYFIDTENLEIEEKNIFTAIESITLIPTYGFDQYEKFLKTNQWVKEYFPNYSLTSIQKSKDKNYFIKYLLENFFSNRIGRLCNHVFMKITYNRWVRIYKSQFSKEEFEVAFKTRKNVSKNHPKFYQRKVLDLYSQRIINFKQSSHLKYKNIEA